MSTFALKIIACITMFIDHIGYVIFDGSSYFNYIGRIAFPIFAFQISQGYIHTKNVKKYLIRLLMFAIVSQLPFFLFYNSISSGFVFNTIFTLFLGLVCILLYDKVNKVFGIFSTIIFGVIAEICHFDYGFYGVAVIMLFYIFRNNTTLLLSSFIIATILKYSYSTALYAQYGTEVLLKVFAYYFPLCFCTILSSIFIYLYNGKKGHDLKYLLYLFYPLHLLFIYILALCGI